MSDTLPTISADQLTKAVNLAAAGTLSALEADGENEPVTEWQHSDKTFEAGKADTRNSSLKCLETLSTSVSSGLDRLNHLNLSKPSSVYPSRSVKSKMKDNSKNEEPSMMKKYCSRKNYKLMPPLIPSQVRTNLKKPGLKMVQERQLVTLSHVHNSAELAALPVRPACYATNYVFVRTAHIVPSVSGADNIKSTAVKSVVTSSMSSPTVVTSCVQNVNSPAPESPIMTATSSVKLPIASPILLSFPKMEHSSQSMTSMSLTLTPLNAKNDMKHSTRFLAPTKLQPLFRLPFPVSGVNSSVIVKALPLSNEGSSLNKIKEITCVDMTNSHSLQLVNLADNEASVTTSDCLLKQQILSPSASSSSKTTASSIKHNKVPVSTQTSEFAVLTTVPSPVVVTAKLNHTATLTVDSRHSPLAVTTRSSHCCSSTGISPQQVGLLTSTCSSQVSSCDTINSVSKKIPSPNVSHVDAPSVKSPIIIAHLVKPVNKQDTIIPTSSVQLTNKHFISNTLFNHSVTTKKNRTAKTTSDYNRSGDGQDNLPDSNCVDVSDNKQNNIALSVQDNKVACLVHSLASTVEEVNFTKSHSGSINTCNDSKRMVETKSVKKLSKHRGQKLKKFPPTRQSKTCSIIPASLQSAEFVGSQPLLVASPGVTLPPQSTLAASPAAAFSTQLASVASPAVTFSTQSANVASPAVTFSTASMLVASPGITSPTQSVLVASPDVTLPTQSALVASLGITLPSQSLLVASVETLPKISLVTSSGIPAPRESKCVWTPSFSPNFNSDAPKSASVDMMSSTSLGTSTTDIALQQHDAGVLAASSVKHIPLARRALPHKLEEFHKPCTAHDQLSASPLPSSGENTCGSAVVSLGHSISQPVSESHEGNTHPFTASSQTSFSKLQSASLPLSPCLKEVALGPRSPKCDMSVPLSKEVAAAAMVSLSTMCAFSDSDIAKAASRSSTLPIQQVVAPSNSAQSTKAPPQFLIHSSDRSKLVISPAGIQHLQSLLRKQGISEGYFIIASPRVPSAQVDVKLPTEKSDASPPSSDGNRNNLFDKMTPQISALESSEKYPADNPPASGFVKTFGSKPVDTCHVNPGIHDKDGHGLADKHECLDLDTDHSDNEHCSSSDSRSSSAALIIETGEEDDRMDIDRQCSDGTDKEQDETGREDILSNESSEVRTASDEGSTTDHSLPKLTQDTAWETESVRSEDARQCIPQSPLSLSDLVRQQQNRSGFSRHLEYSFLTSPESKMKEPTRRNDSESPRPPSSESHDFQFPVPLCPASSFSSASQQHHHHHHPGSDMQSSFQHNMFTATPSFSTELSFESSVQHSSLDQHLEEDVPSTSPKLLSSSVSAPSPKSPLSVSSSQALDQNTPLNPPMTPNTMLINLLNRVPTPFLTNPQEILSIPASQESVVQETDNAGGFELPDNKTTEGVYQTKALSFPSGQSHTQLDASDGTGENLLYTESSRSLSSNTGSYAGTQNALELIASNYSPSCTRHSVLSHDMDTSQLPSSFAMINSKFFTHSSYTHCQSSGQPQSLHFSENFEENAENRDVCNVFHCKSCSGPLLVTVNLEPEVATEERKVPGSLLGNYEHTNVFDQTLNLPEHSCNGERSEVSSMEPEKSRETDILRHLILNTSSSSIHTLQPVANLRSQQYSNTASTYHLSHSHHTQADQFECRVESFLEPENQHKNLSVAEINQSSTFSSQDESFLHINHVHTQPSPSYDSSRTSFQASAHQSYENTASSSFDNRNSSSLSSQADASYIMQPDMSSETPFGVQNMTKSNMAMSHDFMESGGRLQHLSAFRTNHQTELFYQHSDQPDIHQHHYDAASQHQGLDYHLDNLPSSHPQHQFSASLPHQDSSRMFSDQVGGQYLNSQYQSQYYDAGGVAPSLPMFPQQCVVGSEAPAIGSAAEHPCNIPFSSAPSDLQLGFRFTSDDEDGNNIEKQPVLPSVSFSPPSVADQAATPDPAGMSIYQGSFPNLSMYDMYMRGVNGDARGAVSDTVQESGNFCVECNIMYKSQCKFHPCDYVYVTDTPILSHARLTLPSCLKLGTSSVVGHINNTGVFAKEKIAVRTKFGPLIGSPVSCDKLSSTRSFSLWQTFMGPSVKVMNTNDENSSNWLMFLKPARVSLEQNLVAFQHGASVYFVTRADIQPGQELLYWFSKDYSHMLGIASKSKNTLHQLCPHCPVCKQVFPDRKQVHSHVRVQHPKPCTKRCNHCSRKFSQVSHLNAHIASVHLRVKKFVCPQCGKHFSDSSNFRKHVKSHNDERLFKCLICGKAFRQKAHLKLHMNTHMPVKNEECAFCRKRFTRAFTRKQHELMHTKQNKIHCAHCDKVFYKQQVYKQHLKIHNNERKYLCSHCNKAFRTKANLTRHGLTCKQQKCVGVPAPAASSLQGSQIQAGDFLHPAHPEVNLTTYNNDATASSDNV